MTWSDIVSPLSIITPWSRAVSTILTDVVRTGTSWMSTTSSWNLRLVRVQCQPAWTQPGFDVIETAGETIDGLRSIIDWRTCIDLAVVGVLVQDEAVIRHHSTEISCVLYRTNSIGPRTDSCGTSNSTDWVGDNWPPYMLIADFCHWRTTSANAEPFQTSRTCVVVVAAAGHGRRSRRRPTNPASRVVDQRRSRRPTWLVAWPSH